MLFITVTSLFAALAAAASTNNDFNNPKGGYSFTAGESTTLTWDHKSGSTVSLRLQSGSVTTANSGTVIACKYSLILYHHITSRVHFGKCHRGTNMRATSQH